MKALIEAGADVLACETIPCLTEAKAIVRLLKEFPETYASVLMTACISVTEHLHLTAQRGLMNTAKLQHSASTARRFSISLP